MFQLLPCLRQKLPLACYQSLSYFGGFQVSLYQMHLMVEAAHLQSLRSELSHLLGGQMLSPRVVFVNLDLVVMHLALLVAAVYLCLE